MYLKCAYPRKGKEMGVNRTEALELRITSILSLVVILTVLLTPMHPAYSVGYVFSSPITVNAGQPTFVATMAVSNNDVYLVWLQPVTTVDVFFARSTDGGSTFQAPIQISADGTADADTPRIAAYLNHVYISWDDQTLGHHQIFFANSTNNGSSFSGPTNISNSPVVNASSQPQIATYLNNVYLLWTETNTTSGNSKIQFTKSINNGTNFSVPIIISSNSGLSTVPQVATYINHVYVAWETDVGLNGDIFFTNSTNFGTSFSSPSNLSKNVALSTNPQIASSKNNLYVVWKDFTPGTNQIFLQASNNNGTTFGSTINLSGTTGTSDTPQIATSGKSNSYVIWTSDTPGTNQIFFSKSIDNGTSFSSALNLSNDSGSAITPQIALSNNNVFAIWADNTPGNDDIFFKASLDGGNSFGSFINISNDAGSSTGPFVSSAGTTLYSMWEDDTSGAPDVLFSKGQSSAIDIAFSPLEYKLGGPAGTLTITSPLSNITTGIDALSARVSSTTDPIGLTLTLTETGGKTAVFTSPISMINGSSSGTQLKGSTVDTIT